MGVTGSTRLVPDISEYSADQASLAQPSSAQSSERSDAVARLLLWSCILLLAVAGLVGVSPELTKLWNIWTTDPLRSIGMLILPTSIVLILRIWKQNGWELQGTWWGFLPVVLSFVPAMFSERLVFFWSAGNVKINFLPSVLPVYLYACGLVLLFAGVLVWRRAWFPLMLLLLLQPVPQAVVQFLDLPMQGLSAHIARSFAALLGLSPANTELLRLMFTPSFGMFIAPGCDGMRGAITMAYGALIAGYLKRVPILRWIIYVASAFLLGHIFNLLRLCALVFYYKIALGHPAFEHLAKQADYMIGGLLFLVAAMLFLWIVSKKANVESVVDGVSQSEEYAKVLEPTYWRLAALALLVIVAIAPGIHAVRTNSESVALAIRRGEITAQGLNDRIPAQFGNYRLMRAWQEQMDGSPTLEAAAFAATPEKEIEIGIWLPPTDHSIQASMMTHGELPRIKATEEIITAGGQPVPFNIALYDDGVTDSFVGNTYCNPSYCVASIENAEGIHLAVTRVMDYSTQGKRLVPIFFKAQVPHTDASDRAVYSQLLSECHDFLSSVDFTQLGKRFQ
jgi:exosortase J